MAQERTTNIVAYRSFRSVPSFWSEQFDLYIQGVGSPSARPDRRVRRHRAGATEIHFELTGPHIVYALGVNAQREIALVRRLIERWIAVDPAQPWPTRRNPLRKCCR
jgi:hypothetical protein